MVANLQSLISDPQSPGTEAESEALTCALCGMPTHRHITATFNDERLHFCCYGCHYIYDIVAPEVAKGVDLPQAMAEAGLDLNAPCCRGVIHGDPAEEADHLLSRLMLNAFLAMMVMVLSLALYSDFFFNEWGEIGQGVRSMLQVTAMLFATPAVLLLAVPILENALFTFRVYRQLSTSALIAIGSLAAYGLSVYATFTGQGHTYFETATMTLLLVTLGRWLDAKAKVDGSQALDELLARAPVEASLIEASQEIRTPVEALRVGDQIRVRPGENFAVDGRVIDGQGSVNEANITGESEPAYKGAGSTVYAGTTNVDGSFVVEATHVGEERVMGKLVRLLDEARLHRSPIERLADRVAAYFVPLVILLATATFVFWTWQVGFEQGLLTALAVLLIACPCALGIATPLAVWAGLGRAAQEGILIRDSMTLEKLSRLHRVFFDKTGTLTTGQPTLAKISMADEGRLGDWEIDEAGEWQPTHDLDDSRENLRHLLQLAASLEHHSEHPLARAIEAAAAGQDIPLLPITQFQAIPGQGIKGQIQAQTIYLGSWRLIEQQRLILPYRLQRNRQKLEQAGLSLVYVGWGGRVQGLLGFVETIRPQAGAMLAEMRRQGLQVEVLTGDSETAADVLSHNLQVKVQSQLLPHDKVSLVEQAETDGSVAMVGDGLNDAPALARASVGIALGCGADVTREAADVSLLGSDLSQINWLLGLARRTYQTIGWNLAWAFAYNLIGIVLAMAGYLHPVLAAVAMVVSSALVVGNSLRIFRYNG